MFLPFLVGYGLAVRQCRAELMATQSWLEDEVAELRRELAAARAELHRLRAVQRDPDATLNSSRKYAFCKRGSVNVRFAPKATQVLRCRELTRCAISRRSAVTWLGPLYPASYAKLPSSRRLSEAKVD
jgi:hypothetical protein